MSVVLKLVPHVVEVEARIAEIRHLGLNLAIAHLMVVATGQKLVFQSLKHFQKQVVIWRDHDVFIVL